MRRPTQRTTGMHQLAAAVIGAAAAASSPADSALGRTVADSLAQLQAWVDTYPQTDGSAAEDPELRCVQIVRDILGGAQVAVRPAAAEGLDVHAALNTYEVSDGTPPGVYRHSAHDEVIGSNGRRLIIRPTPEGLWIGGCLVADPAHLAELAAILQVVPVRRAER